jgi:four helix bundle protein
MAALRRVRTFRDLLVWQQAFALCIDVYRVTDAFPGHERYGLAAELRKTVRSIAYNVAEGHRRTSTLEYIRFLDIACGSAAELETQLLLARVLTYFDEDVSHRLLTALGGIERMLAALMRKLRERASRPVGASSVSTPLAPRPLGS